MNKQVSKKNKSDDSKLAPPVAELMKMLFNVESYRLYSNFLLYLVICVGD